MPQQLVLVKHALPVLDEKVPPRLWTLSDAGEGQASRLAGWLRPYLPFALVCSREPKARRTCEIVAGIVRLPMRIVEGLEELDRPALPILSRDEHRHLNRRIFEDLSKPAIGEESGLRALARFSRAVDEVVSASRTEHVVAITHGTVMSLFVAQHSDIDAWDLWNRLQCPSFVVLEMPGFHLKTVIERLD